MRILIVEDDTSTAESIERGLQELGHVADRVSKAEMASSMHWKTPMIWLGLARTKAIADFHGARIDLSDSNPDNRAMPGLQIKTTFSTKSDQ